MSIYNNAYKYFPQKTNKKYCIYIKFNKKVNSLQLAKELKHKIKDFGTDKNNTLSMSFIFKNRCKNFMLEMKKLILKDKNIKKVSIREEK